MDGETYEAFVYMCADIKRIADALESIAARMEARDEEAHAILTGLRAEAEQVLTEVEEENE